MVRWNPVKFGDLWNHQVIGGIVRGYLWYCGRLRKYLWISDRLWNPQGVFAQTRQGSEETLRISHLTHLRLRPRSQQTDFEQARTLVCHYARSPLRGRPLRGRSRAFQHLMSKNLPVLPHFVAVNSQGRGVRAVLWEYGWCWWSLWLVGGEVGLWWCCVVSNPVNGVVG